MSFCYNLFVNNIITAFTEINNVLGEKRQKKMKLTFKKYGQLQGRDLCEFVLENDHGMSVKLLNYGATLEDVAIPVDGAKRHVILLVSLPVS